MTFPPEPRRSGVEPIPSHWPPYRQTKLVTHWFLLGFASATLVILLVLWLF